MAFSSGRSDDVDPDGFFENISKAQSLHNLHRRNSGTIAYDKAFNDVRDKLADQEAAKKAWADCVVNLISLAVTILIGGWMSVRLGRATLSRAVGDAARYMPGEASGEAQKKLGAAATSGMAGAGTQNSLFVVTTTMVDKLDFYLDLDTWVTAHNVSPNSVHTAIKRSGLSAREKDALANHANRTRFIADAPSGTRVASTERAAEAIERALWMGFLLDMDYLQTSYEDWGSNSSHTAWSDAGGIAAVPGSPSYPVDRAPRLGSRCYFKLSDGFDAGGLQRALVAIPEIGRKSPI